ncbi:MAG: hypothetical protein MRJ67_18515, partial [Nitrospirales bacterium]|nr:hypothetical protein [Nitrospirales bacterium]
REVGQFGDGVIIGSALVRYISEHHSTPTFLTDIQGMAQQWKSVLLPVAAKSATIHGQKA